MDSKRIGCFVALAEQLHFSRAADVLFMSQSSLSYNISELERELGVQLFVRNRHKVLLTATGTALLPLAREFMAVSQSIERLSSTTQKASPGNKSLDICFDKSFERFDLLGIHRAVADLRLAHPDSRFNVSHAEYSDMTERLIAASVDIGFVTLCPGERPGEQLNTVCIARDTFALAFSARNPCDIGQVLTGSTLCLGANDKRWGDYLIRAVNQLGHSPNIGYFSDLNTIISVVEMSPSHFTVLPALQLKAELASRPHLEHIDIPLECASVDYYAIWARDNYNMYIQLLLDHLDLPND